MTEINARLLTEPVDGREPSPFVLEASNPSGHSFRMDAGPAIGGKDQGMRPMESILAGLAGCSSVDILLILKRGRQTVKSFDVKVTADRAETDPKVFTKINLHFKASGDISEKRLSDAIRMSIDKYCSVAAMLNRSATISTSYELIPT